MHDYYSLSVVINMLGKDRFSDEWTDTELNYDFLYLHNKELKEPKLVKCDNGFEYFDNNKKESIIKKEIEYLLKYKQENNIHIEDWECIEKLLDRLNLYGLEPNRENSFKMLRKALNKSNTIEKNCMIELLPSFLQESPYGQNMIKKYQKCFRGFDMFIDVFHMIWRSVKENELTLFESVPSLVSKKKISIEECELRFDFTNNDVDYHLNWNDIFVEQKEFDDLFVKYQQHKANKIIEKPNKVLNFKITPGDNNLEIKICFIKNNAIFDTYIYNPQMSLEQFRDLFSGKDHPVSLLKKDGVYKLSDNIFRGAKKFAIICLEAYKIDPNEKNIKYLLKNLRKKIFIYRRKPVSKIKLNTEAEVIFPDN